MKLDYLIKFFKHVSKHEASHGIPNAFRFKAILSSHKKGSICPAHYKEDGDGSKVDEELENVLAPPQRKCQKPQREADKDVRIIK